MQDLDIPMKRLQAADKLLGWLVCALLQPLRWSRARAPQDVEPERVLLIKFWGIGSLQLLTPAVGGLRARHPRASIVLLTLSENEAFARGLGLFDQVATLDVRAGRGLRGWARTFARILALALALRRTRFDRVYDFEFFTRFSSLIALATGARDLRGFAAPHVWRGGFHTTTVPFNRYWHVARNFRALAGGEDASDVLPDDLRPYRVEPSDRERVRAKLDAARLPSGRPYVVLNPNAGRLSLERRWPAPAFAELARALGEEDDTPVVLVGGKGEAEYVGGIARAVGPLAPGLVVDLSGALSIGELAALLEGAGAVVTNDSGPMHLAAALGAPTVGLFGPETPVMYGPIGPRARALWKPPACSPCINVHDNKVATCIHGFAQCLTGISVDEVLAETRSCLWDGLLAPIVPLARRAREAQPLDAEPVAR